MNSRRPFRLLYPLTVLLLCSGEIAAQGNKNASPSYDCSAARGIIETLICQDPALSALDRKMADVYAAAEHKASNEFPMTLRPEQRGWVKGRNECWKSDDRTACVSESYRLRIAELQARYRLIEPLATVTYLCPGNAEVVAVYFTTEPPTLIAERGDSVSLMYSQPSASGARYAGRNESLWEHQGEALIQWGYAAPEELCKKQP